MSKTKSDTRMARPIQRRHSYLDPPDTKEELTAERFYERIKQLKDTLSEKYRKKPEITLGTCKRSPSNAYLIFRQVNSQGQTPFKMLNTSTDRHRDSSAFSTTPTERHNIRANTTKDAQGGLCRDEPVHHQECLSGRERKNTSKRESIIRFIRQEKGELIQKFLRNCVASARNNWHFAEHSTSRDNFLGRFLESTCAFIFSFNEGAVDKHMLLMFESLSLGKEKSIKLFRLVKEQVYIDQFSEREIDVIMTRVDQIKTACTAHFTENSGPVITFS